MLTTNHNYRAAEARLGFMTKYPNAFSTLSTRNHLTAVEDNINSIKAALKEIETQKKSEFKPLSFNQTILSEIL